MAIYQQQLDRLAEEYFEDSLSLYPVRTTQVGDDRYDHLYTAPFSTEVRERTTELAERYLRQQRAMDRAALDGERRLTYDVFQHNQQRELADQRFPWHLQPLNQFFNFTRSFVQMGSDTGIHPFRNANGSTGLGLAICRRLASDVSSPGMEALRPRQDQRATVSAGTAS